MAQNRMVTVPCSLFLNRPVTPQPPLDRNGLIECGGFTLKRRVRRKISPSSSTSKQSNFREGSAKPRLSRTEHDSAISAIYGGHPANDDAMI